MSEVFTESELKKDDEPGSETQVSSGQSGTIGGQAQAPKAQTDSASGQFVNLQGYLNANQGDSANQTAQGVVNHWGTDNKAAQGEVTGKADQFKKDVQTNTFGFSDNEANTVQNNASSFNPNSLPNLNRWFTQEAYAGPTKDNVSETMASGKVDELKKELGNQTPAGLKTSLVSTYSKNGNYSKGDRKLDNLLISGDPTALSTVSAARQGTLDNLEGFLKTTGDDLTGLATTAQTGTNESIGRLRDSVTKGTKGEAAGVAGAVKRMNADDRVLALDAIKREMAAAGVTGNAEDYLSGSDGGYQMLSGKYSDGLTSMADANALGSIDGTGSAYGSLNLTAGHAYGTNIPGLTQFITGEKQRKADEAAEAKKKADDDAAAAEAARVEDERKAAAAKADIGNKSNTDLATQFVNPATQYLQLWRSS